MLQFKEILLVRHGDYRDTPERLTKDGIAQSHEAATRLAATMGIGTTALLLSSNAPRALESAQIIADQLSLTVVPSTRLKIIGNNPDGVASFEAQIDAALAETGQPETGDTLILVAHKPLLEAAAGGVDGIRHGEIVVYSADRWSNPFYSEKDAAKLQTRLQDAGLV